MFNDTPADPTMSDEGGFFASFVESCSDPVITVDTEGVVYANPATEAVLGYSPSVLRGRALESLLPDGDEPQLRSIRGRLADVTGLADIGDIVVPLVCVDGAIVRFSARFHEHALDGETVYTGVFRGDLVEGGPRDLAAFRNVVEHAGHAIYVTDTDGTIEYVNPAFTEHTGYEAEEAIGRTPALLSSGEMPPGYFESLWATIEAGEVWKREIVDRRKDGEQYHAHQTIAPVLDDDGSVSRYVAIQTDVTERKTTERQLNQYREVVEQLSDPILLQNRDGEFELLNEAVSEFAGVPREELYGTDEFSFMDPETAAFIEERRQEVMETETPVAYETTPGFELSGREATFSTRRFPYYAADGTLVGTFAICREVSHIKERERELERFARAIDGATDLIAAVDPDGRFLFANDQYRTFHGIGEEDVSGLSLTDVVDDDQHSTVRQNVNRALRGETVEYRTTRTHPDRGTRTFDVRYYPLSAPSGRDSTGGVVGVLRDVTESENRARQLQVVDRVLQHNLRNALTVIRGRASQILTEETGPAGSDSGETAEAASSIVSRADDLLTTSEKARQITDVLSDPPNAGPVDIDTTVEQIVESVSAAFPDATVTATTPDETVVVSATDRIGRAIEELLRNAIDHHDGDHPSVRATVVPDDERVEVRIADDGPGLTGMNRDVLESGQAVDALYHGSGLGLWMVYWVLQQSGGSATVRDADPRGTVVSVSLPRRDE